MKTRKIALILLMLALLVVIPVYAQDNTTEVPAAATEQATESQPVAGAIVETPTENQAPGLPAGILLIGAIAVAVVGGLSLQRENYKAPPGK